MLHYNIPHVDCHFIVALEHIECRSSVCRRARRGAPHRSRSALTRGLGLAPRRVKKLVRVRQMAGLRQRTDPGTWRNQRKTRADGGGIRSLPWRSYVHGLEPGFQPLWRRSVLVRFHVWAIAAKGQTPCLREFAIFGFPENSGRGDSPTWMANTWEEEEASGWFGTLRLRGRGPAGTLARPATSGKAEPGQEDKGSLPNRGEWVRILVPFRWHQRT